MKERKSFFMKLPVLFLAGCMAAGCWILPVKAAADEDYTYTVRLFSGEHSTLKNGGEMMVEQVEYGKPLPFSIRDVTPLGDGSKYYIRGIRESGRDNNTTPPVEEIGETYTVTEDRDYVVSYGVLGNSVAYTVRYEDAQGNELAPAETYYGNIGDRPVVAFLYIEGYIPQAYNLTGTLHADPADNVFTFTYNRMSQQAQEAANEVISGGTGTVGAGTEAAGGTGAGGGTGTAGAGGAGAPAEGTGTEDVTGAEAEAAVGAAADVDGNQPDNVVSVDEEVPLAGGEEDGRETVSSEDEATPLVGSMDFATLLLDVPPVAKAGIFSTEVLIVLAIVYVVLRKKGKIPSYVEKLSEAFGRPRPDEKGKVEDAE